MQVASLDYSNFVGRIAIGRVFRGDIREGGEYTICKSAGVKKKVKIKKLPFEQKYSVTLMASLLALRLILYMKKVS